MNEFNHKLSIVIPVYNEERTLRKLIEAVEDAPLQMEKEIILIDDGSTDGTREILKTMSV
ncbi:MAG: glycosyltransferase, partial [Candidatus Buchananbacteria bacterium]|nr:glycosyltransferase [Candidatus Buchananbacteria bacterium]